MDRGLKTLQEHWEQAKLIHRQAKERKGIPEFPTSLVFLDELTGGMNRGEIWIIAGRTGCGKTSLGLQLAKSFADDPNHSILFFSLEMKGWELVLRMFCEITRVSYFDFITGKVELNPEKEAFFVDYINTIDFEIIECGYTFQEVDAAIKKYYQNKKPDVIFLDFIQLIEWKRFGEERVALMEYIRQIKEWTKRYDISFVVISQLRRLPSGANYQREPGLLDLKGSGSLEQTADKVIFVFQAIDENDNVRWFLNLAKNRQGRTGKREVIFDGEHYRFTDIGNVLVGKVVKEFEGRVV